MIIKDYVRNHLRIFIQLGWKQEDDDEKIFGKKHVFGMSVEDWVKKLFQKQLEKMKKVIDV